MDFIKTIKTFMLKNEKENFFLSLFAVFLIVGFLIWQGILNINSDIQNTIADLKDKKISISVYDQRIKSLDQERESYDFSKSKMDKINNYFVYASDNDDAEFTNFFGQLDNIAMQSTQKEKTLTIDLYQNESSAAKDKKKPSDSKDATGKNDTKDDSRLLKLTLRSNFESLMKFIANLEAMQYYIYIESVNINIDNNVRSRNKLDKDISSNNSIDLQTVLIIKVFRKTNIL